MEEKENRISALSMNDLLSPGCIFTLRMSSNCTSDVKASNIIIFKVSFSQAVYFPCSSTSKGSQGCCNLMMRVLAFQRLIPSLAGKNKAIKNENWNGFFFLLQLRCERPIEPSLNPPGVV